MTFSRGQEELCFEICAGVVCSASLHAYKNEDISVGSWMLGLDIEHVDDRSFCCVASLPGWLPTLLIRSCFWHDLVIS